MSWSRTSVGTTKTLKMGLVCEPMSRSNQRNSRTTFGLNSRVGEGTCHAKAYAHPVHDARRCRAVARGPDEDPSGGFAKGARVVNDPGSLNFNGLNTRDVEGARSFYGSVFGWQTLALDFGAEMWTLPGHGDYLERYHPDLREQWAEAGAQPGFATR